MNIWIKRSLWALPVLGVAGAIAWWMMPKKMPAELRYTTAKIERGSITQTVSANGTLNPVVLVSVGTQVSGIVNKLHADFNDHVQAGQILLELDPALIRAQLQQSEASVASAKASLELAQANEARLRNLFEREYVAKQDLDQGVQTLKAAQAQLASAQAQAQRDRANLGYTVIRSPVSGVVVSRSVDVGQTVAASFQTPTLFTIAQDLSRMQIDTSYAEADVGSIKVGQRATFRVDAFPNRTFHGEVHQVRLNPTTNQNVVTYDVVISVENPEQILLPGMTAYVNITVAHREDTLTVPNAALRFRPADAAAQQRGAPGAGMNPGGGGQGRGDSAAGGRPGGGQFGGDRPRGERPEGSRPEGGRQGGDRPRGERGNRGSGDSMQTQMGTLYVIENGQPKAVRVPVGITDNRMTEISGGDLPEGTSVIVEDRQSSTKGGGRSGGGPGGPPMRLF